MFQGTLRKNDLQRWEIVGPSGETLELSSGVVIEVRIGGQWTKTSIEHHGTSYYATAPDVKLENGLTARARW